MKETRDKSGISLLRSIIYREDDYIEENLGNVYRRIETARLIKERRRQTSLVLLNLKKGGRIPLHGTPTRSADAEAERQREFGPRAMQFRWEIKGIWQTIK